MGDTAYGTAPMLEYLVKEKQIEPHILVWEKSVRNDGTYSRSDFIWNNDANYWCVTGDLLKKHARMLQKITP